MRGGQIVAEWERRQTAGRYESYEQSMADLARMIDDSEPVITYEKSDSYREQQIRLREAGFDAYNCDMVDEFPRWA